MFTDGGVTVTGTLMGYSDDLPPNCGGIGADRFYRVQVTELSEFSATVSGNTIRPAVSLWSACGAATATTCVSSAVTGTAVSIPRRLLTPGTWLLAVEDVNGLAAPFTLQARLGPPSGATCNVAIPIELIGNSRTVTGTTSGAVNDRAPACNINGGDDVTHSLTLAERARLSVVATPTGGHALFAPTLEITRGACGSLTSIACDTTTSHLPSSVLTGVLDAGQYSVWVDSFYPGTYSLAVVATPEVSGDLCSNLTTTTLDAGVPVRLTGALANAFSDVTLSCGAGGRDVGYRFVAPANAYFEANVTALDGGATTLELRGPDTACPGSTATATCRTGMTSTRLTRNGLAAGTYHLWLKGSGAYDLDLLVASALPGERCTNPLPLTFTNDVATVSGSTADALDDVPPSFGCGIPGVPEVVYAFTLTTARSFSATATGARPSLFLRSTCTNGLDLCATAPAVGQGAVSIGPQMLMPGTHFLVVETSPVGAFTINATLQ